MIISQVLRLLVNDLKNNTKINDVTQYTNSKFFTMSFRYDIFSFFDWLLN